MSEGKRQRNNQRQAQRKKGRHTSRVDKKHEEILYREAQLDPETVEGQSKISIDRISPPTEPKPLTWTETFWSYLGY